MQNHVLNRYLLYVLNTLFWFDFINSVLNIMFSLKSETFCKQITHLTTLASYPNFRNFFSNFRYPLSYTNWILSYIVKSTIKVIFCTVMWHHSSVLADVITTLANQGIDKITQHNGLVCETEHNDIQHNNTLH